jgi:hypothetical protein
VPDCLHIIAMLASLYSLTPAELTEVLAPLPHAKQVAIVGALNAVQDGEDQHACDIIVEMMK